MLAGIGPFGPMELIVILLILVMVFGATRLVDIGGSLGKGIREFRRNVKDSASEDVRAPGTCPNCGRENENEAKFCAECGTELRAPVG